MTRLIEMVVTKGRSVVHDGKTYGQHSRINLPPNEAIRLEEMGFVLDLSVVRGLLHDPDGGGSAGGGTGAAGDGSAGDGAGAAGDGSAGDGAGAAGDGSAGDGAGAAGDGSAGDGTGAAGAGQKTSNAAAKNSAGKNAKKSGA